MMYFYPTIIQKSIDCYLKFYEINYFYSSIYFNSFYNAIKEVNNQNIIKERQALNENNKNNKILLNIWFKIWIKNLMKD
jgi:hypothetical protein